MNHALIQLFYKGGPIMWPLLMTSLTAMTVVIERFIFIMREKKRRNPDLVDKILESVEEGEIETAILAGQGTKDFVARTLIYGLANRGKSFSNALLRAANLELKRFNQGLVVLDTISLFLLF